MASCDPRRSSPLTGGRYGRVFAAVIGSSVVLGGCGAPTYGLPYYYEAGWYDAVDAPLDASAIDAVNAGARSESSAGEPGTNPE